MTKVTHTLILLLLGAFLLTGAAAAADTAEWEFDTTDLIQQDSKNYSFTGNDLLLPVLITGFDGDAITRMEITATIVNGDGEDITDTLNYVYQSGVTAQLMGQEKDRSWSFAMAGAEINDDCQAFLLNISGLDLAVDPYTITLDIWSGRGMTDSEDANVEISISIINWLITETTDNTLPDYLEDDAWHYTIPAEVCYILIPNPIAGTYDSEYPFPVIAQYEDETSLLEDYVFALPLTPDNATIVVNKSDDKITWDAVDTTTSVTQGLTGYVTLTVSASDADAEWLKISFIGKNLGDVTDMDNDKSISTLTDIDYILTAVVDVEGVIDDNRLIYGDLDGNGLIELPDAQILFEEYYVRSD